MRSKEAKGRQSARTNKEPLQKRRRTESQAKEEGEISESEQDRYQQFKEEKWREWCSGVMSGEMKTLKRLQKLQTTSGDLPKEEVLFKIRNYLQLLGRRIDDTIREYEEHKRPRMTMRLWNYVSSFSNLSGERLAQIYSKLKQEQQAEVGVGPSHLNGAVPSDRESDPYQTSSFVNGVHKQRPYRKSFSHSSEAFHKDQESGKSEAWKRRRREHMDGYQQPSSNGSRSHDPHSAGILGRGPADSRHYTNERPNRTRQTRFPSGQLR